MLGLNKFIIALAVLLAFCTFAHALTISAPTSVEIKDDLSTFFVSITNDSSEALPLTINFYTTTRTNIFAPKTINPYSTVRAKISVYNDSVPNYHEVESKLEIYAGKQLEEQSIFLKFFEKQKPTMIPTQKENIDQNSSWVTSTGFFSLGSFFNETNSFNLVDWTIFWILVLIAAVLVVAFISRVVRRI